MKPTKIGCTVAAVAFIKANGNSCAPLLVGWEESCETQGNY